MAERFTQPALFTPKPPPPKPAPPTWGVWLNEIGLMSAAPDVMNWWAPYRHRFEHSGKIRLLGTTVPGDVILIGPYDDRDDAQFLHDHLLAKGTPKALVKVRRWRAAANG